MRRSLTIACVAALAWGCSGTPDADLVYVDDFESRCEGLPCGWVQSGGEPGLANYIETVPGDHGIELLGDGTWVRGPVEDMLPITMFADQIVARIIARCDTGSSIEIRVTIGQLSTIAPTVTFGAELVPEDVWTRPLPDETLDPLGPTTSDWTVQRVLGVSLLKHGEGSCEIDYLGIRAVRTGFPI